MALKYYAGDRVTGTNSDRTGLTTTNVLAGTSFLETDTNDLYHWDGSSWDLIAGNTIAETLAAKTLTTPTISSTGFANAVHAHAAANSGGQVTVPFANTTGTLAVDRGGTGATSLNNLITLSTHTTGNYVATITGGTGITSSAATSGEGTTHSLSVDVAQTQITTIGTAGVTTNIAAGDLTIYNAVNDGNPTISLGSAAAERLIITANYASGTQTLNHIKFATATASTAGDMGNMVFDVDGTQILTIDDGGLIIKTTGTIGPVGDEDLITLTASGSLVTVAGALTVTGNFIVSGTTTTVDSTVLTVVDPIITLQTASGGGALGADSNKDVGIAMQYHTGSAAKTAFLGLDDTDYALMYIPDASISSEVVSGSIGTIKANLTGAVTGNADTATALATGRTIGMTGDVVWTSASFTGAGPVTGVATIGATKVTGAMLNDDSISGQAELTSGIATTDELLISDGGVLKRIDTAVLYAATATLTNKSIDLGTNTLTGSVAEFNAALQSESFATLGGTETLVAKTLTTPTVVATGWANANHAHTASNTGGTIATITGNAVSATLASTVTVVDSTDTSSYIAMFDSATGSLAPKTDAGITYNAGTGALTIGSNLVLTSGGIDLQDGGGITVTPGSNEATSSLRIEAADEAVRFTIDPIRTLIAGADHTGVRVYYDSLDTTGSTTTSVNWTHVLIEHLDYAVVSAQTVTNAATLKIAGPPTATGGETVTFTNGALALWVDAGTSRFDGNIDLNSSGTIINVANSASDWTNGQLTVKQTANNTSLAGVDVYSNAGVSASMRMHGSSQSGSLHGVNLASTARFTANASGGIFIDNQADAAIYFADSGGINMTISSAGLITAAAGITSTAAANTFGATSFNGANITNIGNASSSMTSQSWTNAYAGSVAILSLESYSTNEEHPSRIILAASDVGTLGSHTAVTSGKDLGEIYFSGSDGSTFKTAAKIMSEATETHSGSASGGNLQFFTVDNASTTPDLRMQIDHNGLITASAGITSTAAANTLGATSFNDANITNVDNIALDSISADGTSIGLFGNEHARFQIYHSGTFSPAAGGTGISHLLGNTLNAVAGENAFGMQIGVTLVEAGSGTHGIFAGLNVQPPTITTAGGGTTTNAAALRIENETSGATSGNFALWVADGKSRFDGILDVTDATDSSDASGDTGALKTEGGVSIAKKLYVGTNLYVGNGNVSLPSISFISDPDSGLYYDGGDTLVLATGGAKAFTVTSSQRFWLTQSGAAGTPSYSWDNDSDTGMYRYDIDGLAFTTGGVARVQINSSGAIGIGTAPATARFVDIRGTFTGVGDDVQGLAVTGTYTLPVDGNACGVQIQPTLVEADSGTHTYMSALNIEKPTITARDATVTNAATVRIGGTPTVTVSNSNGSIGHTTASLWIDGHQNTVNGDGVTGVGASPALLIETAGTTAVETAIYILHPRNSGYRSRIAFANTYSAGEHVASSIEGSSYLNFFVSDNNNVANVKALELASTTGDATFINDINYAGDLTDTSDERVKGNIQTISGALGKIAQMRGVSYKRLYGNKADHVGLVAQELELLAPELVKTGDSDSNVVINKGTAEEETITAVKAVNYSKLTAYLIEAIKELKTEVDILKAS